MKYVYVALVQTGTWFSRFLRFVTKDKYNHATISFSPTLDVMYSFGRKSRYNMLNAGFVEENINKGLYKAFSDSPFCVLEMAVTDSEYQSMQRELATFLMRKDVFKYNFRGLSTFITGIPAGKKDCYFCSQFVSQILAKAQWWRGESSLIKPIDFMDIAHKRIVYEGSLADFRTHCGIDNSNIRAS